ncbi:MAG: hypothetical protein ACREO2_02805 [Arenimonas sp.]
MLIPDYWAEATLKHRVSGKQITVRRFGWSEASQDDAQRNADARAQDAFARVVAGEKLERSEPKVPYNGAFGVPIREQVLSRHDDVVITRNIYGAKCLNTPNVLFADIDFSDEPMPGFVVQVVCLLIIAGAAIGKIYSGWGLAIVLMFSALIIGYSVAKYLFGMKQKAKGTPEQQATNRINAFLKKHPDWRIRLYKTPAGFRALAMHRTFDPAEPEVADFFKEVEADPIYVRMCMHQHCFRARVSPKPWRIGIKSHLKPRPGIWPIKSDRLPDRERWVNDYERKSDGFASCRFMADMGSDHVDPNVDNVRMLHDELCKADSDMPLA